MTTDPIADLLTRIRNGSRAKHSRVDMPSSKLKIEFARILLQHFGYADDGIEWCAQFVRHVGKEAGFRATCFLRGVAGYLEFVHQAGKFRFALLPSPKDIHASPSIFAGFNTPAIASESCAHRERSEMSCFLPLAVRR